MNLSAGPYCPHHWDGEKQCSRRHELGHSTYSYNIHTAQPHGEEEDSCPHPWWQTRSQHVGPGTVKPKGGRGQFSKGLGGQSQERLHGGGILSLESWEICLPDRQNGEGNLGKETIWTKNSMMYEHIWAAKDSSPRLDPQVSGWSTVSDKSGQAGRPGSLWAKLKVCILPWRSRFGELSKGLIIWKRLSLLMAMWPQTRYLTSLCLSFYICEMGIMRVSLSIGVF